MHIEQGSTNVWKITGRIVTVHETAKYCEDGFQYVKLKIKIIYIFEAELMGWQVNTFIGIDEYMKIRSSFKMNKEKR